MKRFIGDENGGIVSTAAGLVVLFIAAAAVSVFLPETWNEITQFWVGINQGLNDAWEILREFFSRF
jgi:hypothetical protein